MATQLAPVPQIVTHSVKPEARGWTSWITTTDHKRIGIMYMVTTFVFFCLGGVEALIIRLQLGAPEQHAGHPPGLQPALHDPRDHDGVPVRRADDGGPCQLLRAADDRRARHGIPAPERAVLLAAAGRRDRLLRVDLLEPAGSGLDELRAAGRIAVLAQRRPGRLDLPGAPHRHLLDPRRDQLLRDDRQHARARHELGPPAAVRVGDPRSTRC